MKKMIYEIFENNYFIIFNLLITILNSIFLYALAWKLNSLNKSLYNTFKINGAMVQKWSRENFYLDDDEEKCLKEY